MGKQDLQTSGGIPGPHAVKINKFPWLQGKLSLFERFRERFGLSESETSDSSAIGGALHSMHTSSVVTLFGGRGTGKTTSLISLLQHLRENNPGDLVLVPPLDPQNFAHGDTTLSWFMFKLQDITDKISKEIIEKRKGFNSKPCEEWRRFCPFRFDERSCDTRVGCLELKHCYERLSSKSRELFQDIRAGETGGELDRRMRQFRMAKGMDFPEHLARFVRCITNAHQLIYGDNKSKNPPLLVVGIDDVDLVSHFLREDLFKFISLTSGIPRLVVITAMDYDLAFLSLKENFLKNTFPAWQEKGHNVRKVWDGKRINNKSEELTDQYLTKYLPYEGRIWIPEWTLEKRALFKPIRAGKEAPPLYMLLEKKLGLMLEFSPALGGKNKQYRFSTYLELLPESTRLLEGAYYFLEGTPDHNEKSGLGKIVRSDRLVLSELARLFIQIPDRKLNSGIDGLVSVSQMFGKWILQYDDSDEIFIAYKPGSYLVIRNKNNKSFIVVVKSLTYSSFEYETKLTKNTVSEKGEVVYTRRPMNMGDKYFMFGKLFCNELPYYNNVFRNSSGEFLYSLKEYSFINSSCSNVTNSSLVEILKKRPSEEEVVDYEEINLKYGDKDFHPDFLEYKFPVCFIVRVNKVNISLPLPKWREPTRLFLFFSYWESLMQNPNRDSIEYYDKSKKENIQKYIHYWLKGILIASKCCVLNPEKVEEVKIDDINISFKELYNDKDMGGVMKSWVKEVIRIKEHVEKAKCKNDHLIKILVEKIFSYKIFSN